MRSTAILAVVARLSCMLLAPCAPVPTPRALAPQKHHTASLLSERSRLE